MNSDSVNGNAMITRERHRFHVQACLDALQRFLARPGQVSALFVAFSMSVGGPLEWRMHT